MSADIKIVYDCATKEERIEALTPEEQTARYVPAPDIPATVTKLQLKKALQNIDKWSDMKTALKTLTEDEQEDWELAVEVARADPLVAQIGAALGLDSAALDVLFQDAAAR